MPWMLAVGIFLAAQDLPREGVIRLTLSRTLPEKVDLDLEIPVVRGAFAGSYLTP